MTGRRPQDRPALKHRDGGKETNRHEQADQAERAEQASNRSDRAAKARLLLRRPFSVQQNVQQKGDELILILISGLALCASASTPTPSARPCMPSLANQQSGVQAHVK